MSERLHRNSDNRSSQNDSNSIRSNRYHSQPYYSNDNSNLSQEELDEDDEKMFNLAGVYSNTNEYALLEEETTHNSVFEESDIDWDELDADDEKMFNLAGVSQYSDTYTISQSQQNQIASNYLNAGWGEVADTENVGEEEAQAITEIGEEVLVGALSGDFNDDPTFWSDVGQIVTGLIPVAGQLGDARDLVHILDDITNQEKYKKIGSWATLVLIVIGFVPGVGDAIKSIGRRGIRYLDNNRITKRIGEWLGDNIISPILERVGDLTAPVVGQIKDAIRRKLAEAQEIARQLGEGAGNVIDDVTGRPQVATEGVGNVPSRMETDPPVMGNEPMQMVGTGGQLKPAQPEKVINDLRSFSGKIFRYGNETLQLDKRGLKHILERHHPNYWNGSIKADQSFLDPQMSISDVVDAISEVMKQNRELIISKGTNSMHQIEGTYKSVNYVVGFNKGRIGQLYPF